MVVNCLQCRTEIQCQRRTKKWCSQKCYARYRSGYPKDRKCLECCETFQILTRIADANRKYCSERCAKRSNNKRKRRWTGSHPDAMKSYNRRRVERNPGEWKEKAKRERAEILNILGNACIVCGIDNPLWLEVDYIPTTRGGNGRHPRHPAFIKEHAQDFRLLCANHHRELTITGKIQGTEIEQ